MKQLGMRLSPVLTKPHSCRRDKRISRAAAVWALTTTNWTVRKGVSSKQPALWFFASLLKPGVSRLPEFHRYLGARREVPMAARRRQGDPRSEEHTSELQ